MRQKWGKALFIAAAVLLIGGCGSEINDYTPQSDTVSGEVERMLVQQINDLRVPGVKLSFRREGEDGEVHTLAEGTVDRERNTPLRVDQVFRIGSVMKVYTAAIILKLIDKGRLGLHTTIDAWFPDIPYADRITVSRLLDHTSGVYDYTTNLGWLLTTVFKPDKNWRPEELVAVVGKGEPPFQPGQKVSK